MKTLSTCLLAIGLFFILSNNTQAQYFNWVTGASGANHGGSIAIDDTGHVYVVGTIDTLDTLGPPQTAFGADSAQFNLFPNFTAQSSQSYSRNCATCCIWCNKHLHSTIVPIQRIH